MGCFSLNVNLLNIKGKAPSDNRQLIYSQGNTKIVIRKAFNDQEFVSKRIYFSKMISLLETTEHQDNFLLMCNSPEGGLERTIIEVSIGKICSALGVGVKMGSPDHRFDLICYENCVEFDMEKCESLRYHHQYHPFPAVEERLKYCLFVMHFFNLVHKDVKPTNILMNSHKQLVLADFDISTAICERPGEKSLTYREGTRAYMSPEMKGINLEVG